ncbi:MAG: hypothetical protein AAF125_14420, partial [Chloroflexota bacterium]
MSYQIPRDIQDEIKQLIFQSVSVNDIAERGVFIRDAFTDHEDFLRNLDMSGSPSVFLSNLMHHCERYGMVDEDT